MKILTTDGRVLDVHVASAPCGYGVQSMQLNAKDFNDLNTASTEAKLHWFVTWAVRFTAGDIKGSSVLEGVYNDLSNLKNVMLENRIKEFEHNLVAWNHSQTKDRKRIHELEVMLRKLATESDCYLEEMLETGFADTSEFADTIMEAEQLYQKETGFKDEK